MSALAACMQLPASFFAYRKQQHRWTCGPVQLWRKAAVDIWCSNISMFRKLELILCYFGVRKVATHWVSLCFFCGLVPLSVFTPEVSNHSGSEPPETAVGSTVRHCCWFLYSQAAKAACWYIIVPTVWAESLDCILESALTLRKKDWLE